jgi:asparagine synthase (glutamine-hydrolysing)
MTESLAHRGPEDAGVYRGERIALGHRRLSILDVSAAGRQPMSDESGALWIVYNGEIYNFRELRRELESCGCRFRTQTDTEVILHAYRQWGLEAVHRFNGMFAFAIWDEAERRLWLVRDPIGIKPLFYSESRGVLRFGSEIKAILADPAVPRAPDLRGLDAFLTFGYTPAPHTGFAAVRQLLPGHQLIVQDERLAISRYYRLPYPDRPPAPEPLEMVIERFRGELLAAVRRQMVSDVPLGAFLSGGVDSSSVVWGMRQASEEKPQAFCAGFEETSFDETPFARQVADVLGIDLHSRLLSADAAALLPVLVSHAEEPLADNSMIPLYLLSAFARERVKVALSGDGGDELLAGYITYKASRFASWYRLLPGPLRRGVVRPLVESLPASQTKYGAAMLARRFVEGVENPPLADHCSWRQIISPREKARLYLPEMQSAVESFDPIAEYAATGDDCPDWLSPLERRMHVDLAFHLPNDMLVKVDRMSMAHGLEVRVPLLDLELVKTCLSLPPEYKLRRGTGKYILKQCLQGVLPPPVLHRKKAGFLIPLEKWLRGPLLPLLRDGSFLSLLQEIGSLSPQRVGTMVEEHASGRRDHAYPLFTLLVLAAWWRRWISGEAD